MPSYKAPLRDIRFVLHEYLGLAEEAQKLGYVEASADLIDAILEEGAKLAEEVLQPINLPGDREGCHFEHGAVRTPAGFKAAYKTYSEGGWGGLSADPDFGGQGLPRTLALAFGEMSSSANMAFSMYPGLSRGAYAALHLHGTSEQKKLFLPKLVSGVWTGTMNLTEPHCGTDLGLIKTRAVPKGDGTYAITGTKIFISAGEHDLAENIIHLVLARIQGAPEGVKGISLFVVPKFLVEPDGTLGPRNGVTCGSIEHKMGIHANATCVINYDGATGTLVGEAEKGLRAMFTMMNEARMGVALQGLAQAEVAYQNAASYARERLQGRALAGPKQKDKPADSIIHHPDVRRMLMNARALAEGGRALLYWTALRGDRLASADSAVREKAEDLMGLLTPVLKAYLTDMGFQSAVECQQVYGGHGYIAENGMEQFVRDARIAMIYEGANGIQALDLVGRKLAANGGRAIFAAFGEIDGFLKETEGNAALKPWTEGLVRARKDLEEATQWLMANGLANPENAAAVSNDYLYLLALTMLAATWAGLVLTAQAKLANGDAADALVYENKIKTGRYFLTNILPATATHLARLKAGAEPLQALAPESF